MPAVTKALTTTELLEAILCKLPMEDLLRAQQVSKYWKQVIAGSIAIQKALFMIPGTATEAAAGDSFRFTYTKADGTTSEIAINPCFFDNDGIVKGYSGYTCWLSRCAIDSRNFPRNFGLMSITQPPIKSRMFIRFDLGDGAPACRRKGVRGKIPATHTGDSISKLLKQIRSSSQESAQKSADNNTKLPDSAIEVTEVFFCFQDPE